ncbi:hypothetical protein RRG08_062130 [Elysia crispata]|uniref:Uncharacterized protein n=1 Tax=Elysia crispata TaxID=231223 RepID=A0AAE1A7B6_9GAST|nr:hypothetical protein RRG08_062130 [Elysia crispata]
MMLAYSRLMWPAQSVTMMPSITSLDDAISKCDDDAGIISLDVASPKCDDDASITSLDDAISKCDDDAGIT